jgi:hypothetical protein
MNAIVFPEFTVSQLTKSVPNPASGVLIVFVRDSLKAFSCVVYALRLENATMDGASGSGAFWSGYHVGNVWAWGLERDARTGQVVRDFTLLPW